MTEPVKCHLSALPGSVYQDVDRHVRRGSAGQRQFQEIVRATAAGDSLLLPRTAGLEAQSLQGLVHVAGLNVEHHARLVGLLAFGAGEAAITSSG